jgi:hypothetical protein
MGRVAEGETHRFEDGVEGFVGYTISEGHVHCIPFASFHAYVLSRVKCSITKRTCNRGDRREEKEVWMSQGSGE